MDYVYLAPSTGIFLIRDPGKYLPLENTGTGEREAVFQLVSFKH